MAVYYKFKSAKDYDRIPIEGHFISVISLKQKIVETKLLGRGKDFNLVVTNAQTNEDYLDETILIPKNTSVLICRVPGHPCMPIVTQPAIQEDERNVEASKPDNAQPTKNNFAGSSVVKNPDDSEWDDEFGGDLYAIPETLPNQISNPVQDAPLLSKADEDSRTRALVDTPALDLQRQGGFGRGRGYARTMHGRGYGRGGYVRKTTSQGYVCYRCHQPGHFIQHCPTNGYPEFDKKKVKHPTGIPKSNEAAFGKVIDGLHCPLCKEVMKDAVLTRKCCFKSFCDTCIRDHIIKKSICVCGSTILADDLIPNKTLRETINETMEINDNSTENVTIAYQVQDRGTKTLQNEESPTVKDAAVQSDVVSVPQTMEKERTGKVADVPEAAKETMHGMEHASQGGPLLAVEEVQQHPASVTGKKKKKKKAKVPSNEMQWENPQDFFMGNYMMPMGAAAYDPYWNVMQPGMEKLLPPFGGPPMPPFMGYGAGPLEVPFGLVPQYPFGGPSMMMPQPPFPLQRDLAEMVVETGLGMNVGPPIMSREEFEAWKADMRKREMERSGGRNLPRDCEFNSELSSSENISSQRLKSNPLPPSTSDHSRQYHSSHQPSPPQEHLHDGPTGQSLPPDHLPHNPNLSHPSSKRQSLDYDHRRRRRQSNLSIKPSALDGPLMKSFATSGAEEADHKQDVGVQTAKKRNSSSTEVAQQAGSSGSKHRMKHHGDDKKELEARKVAMEVDSGSSEDNEDRHFKRRQRRSKR